MRQDDSPPSEKAEETKSTASSWMDFFSCIPRSRQDNAPSNTTIMPPLLVFSLFPGIRPETVHAIQKATEVSIEKKNN
ncbi:MAG: hypothetical protein P1U32_09275 [Legionellaceae bacterium]|nr:hypothetical protein [Legionellaceae bacterium]